MTVTVDVPDHKSADITVNWQILLSRTMVSDNLLSIKNTFAYLQDYSAETPKLHIPSQPPKRHNKKNPRKHKGMYFFQYPAFKYYCNFFNEHRFNNKGQ